MEGRHDHVILQSVMTHLAKAAGTTNFIKASVYLVGSDEIIVSEVQINGCH